MKHLSFKKKPIKFIDITSLLRNLKEFLDFVGF